MKTLFDAILKHKKAFLPLKCTQSYINNILLVTESAGQLRLIGGNLFLMAACKLNCMPCGYFYNHKDMLHM